MVILIIGMYQESMQLQVVAERTMQIEGAKLTKGNRWGNSDFIIELISSYYFRFIFFEKLMLTKMAVASVNILLKTMKS